MLLYKIFFLCGDVDVNMACHSAETTLFFLHLLLFLYQHLFCAHFLDFTYFYCLRTTLVQYPTRISIWDWLCTFSWLKKNLFIGHNFLISHMFLIAIFLQNLTEILHDYEPCDIRIFIFAYGLLSFSEDFYPWYKPVVLNTGIIPRRFYSCVFGRS